MFKIIVVRYLFRTLLILSESLISYLITNLNSKMDENHRYELSEMQPRKPPDIFSYQNVPRVQLMVPEPSMMVNYEPYTINQSSISNNLKPARKPFRELRGTGQPNNENQHNHPSIPQYPTINKPEAHLQEYYYSNSIPPTQQLPSTFDKKKIIDHDLSVSMYSKLTHNDIRQEMRNKHDINSFEKENVSNSTLATNMKENNAAVTIPEEVLDILKKQSEEISSLRGQLQDLTNQLISSNSKTSTQNISVSHSIIEPHIIPDQRQNISHDEPKDKVLMRDASTQTSATASSEIFSEKFRQSEDTEKTKNGIPLFVQPQDLRNNYCHESYHSFPDRNLDAVPIIVNDLEIAPPRLTSFESNHTKQREDIDQRPTEKRFSVETGPDIIDMSKDIKCVDLCPPEDIRKNINDFQNVPHDVHFDNRPSVGNNQIQVNEPTVLQRMRQLDISFLTAEDFNNKGPKSPKSKVIDDCSRMFWPKAAQFSEPSYSQCTSKESMIQNSNALKHLSDEQLTLLARHRTPDREKYNNGSRQNFRNNDITKQSELTQYGISEKNLSKSTIQYLERNKLKK